MKTLMILLTVLILAGCVGTGSTREAPDWGDVRRPKVEVTSPLPLPALCRIEHYTTPEGEPFGRWPAFCTKDLAAYEIVAEANTDIAEINAQALMKTEGAYDNLITAGEMQEELSDFYADLLKEEKQEHWVDNALHKLIIIIGLGAAL